MGKRFNNCSLYIRCMHVMYTRLFARFVFYRCKSK